MSYTPTLQDACTDLYRAVYASMGDDSFTTENYKTFLNHAYSIIRDSRSEIAPDSIQVVDSCIEAIGDERLQPWQRQDKMVTLASLIKG